MHPIEIMVIVGALAAPISGVVGAIRWKRTRQSRPTGWRFWSTFVSLLLSLLVGVEFGFMLIRSAFLDLNAHYDEYLFCLRFMAFTALASLVAAALGRGGGRVWTLVTSFLVLTFVLLVASIPP